MAFVIGGEKTSASIKLSGLPELDAKFAKLKGRVRTSIGKKALRQATNVTLRYAREYVLKDTNQLKKALKTSAKDLGADARKAGNFGMKISIPKKKAHVRDYAVRVEFDRSYGDGTPTRFMKRAVIASEPEAKKIFQTKLQELIRAEEQKAVPSG
jgi:hypothetical protein